MKVLYLSPFIMKIKANNTKWVDPEKEMGLLGTGKYARCYGTG
jgi:hypothetical protein